ncbi:hypothetical protein DVH24_006358, partial [Malus domestica]
CSLISRIIYDLIVIWLNKNTTIVPIEKPNQVIPMHWFNLIEFDELHKKVDRDVNLTGKPVLGSTD